MLLLAGSGLFFGTFVDRHRRKTAMLVSSTVSLGAYLAAGLVYLVTPADDRHDLTRPEFDIPVVQAIAPGLQPMPSEIATERLRRTIAATGGGHRWTKGIPLH